MLHNTLLGSQGEEYVMSFLEKEGYRIRARNYRTARGEIDIIAEHGETIAFVEVKTRYTEPFELSTVITPTKQRRILAAARAYCAAQQIYNRSLRFDVAVVILDRDMPLTYYNNAFTEVRDGY